MLIRFISGLVLAPIVLAIIYVGLPYFVLLLLAITIVMAWELEVIADKVFSPWGMALSALSVATILLSIWDVEWALFLAFLSALILTTLTKAVRQRRALFLGAATLYLIIPSVSLVYLHQSFGYLSVLWLFLVIWATDVGAYLFGTLIGGAKLLPSISPNKTWAGFLGAEASAIGVSALITLMVTGSVEPILAIFAAVLALVAQGGDLCESLFKRHFEVKDSGTLIPGHGGVMDRFDGLCAAAPVAALFGVVIQGGLTQW